MAGQMKIVIHIYAANERPKDCDVVAVCGRTVRIAQIIDASLDDGRCCPDCVEDIGISGHLKQQFTVLVEEHDVRLAIINNGHELICRSCDQDNTLMYIVGIDNMKSWVKLVEDFYRHHPCSVGSVFIK